MEERTGCYSGLSEKIIPVMAIIKKEIGAMH